MRRALASGIGWGLLLLAGCSDESPECAGVQPYGFVIEVVDAETGTPLCDASVHLVHESHDEVLASDGLEPCRYVGGSTAGQYTIEVERDGYETRTVGVEVVVANTCSGLDTRDMSIELAPLP
jgi:hypothetical protein